MIKNMLMGLVETAWNAARENADITIDTAFSKLVNYLDEVLPAEDDEAVEVENDEPSTDEKRRIVVAYLRSEVGGPANDDVADYFEAADDITVEAQWSTFSDGFTDALIDQFGTPVEVEETTDPNAFMEFLEKNYPDMAKAWKASGGDTGDPWIKDGKRNT